MYSSSKFKHCQSFLLTSPIFMFFLMGVSAPHASMSALLTGNRRGGDNTRLICLLFGGLLLLQEEKTIKLEFHNNFLALRIFFLPWISPVWKNEMGDSIVYTTSEYILKSFKHGAFRVIKYHYDLVNPCQEDKTIISILYQEHNVFWSHFMGFEDCVALLRTSITTTTVATARTSLSKDHSAQDNLPNLVKICMLLFFCLSR